MKTSAIVLGSVGIAAAAAAAIVLQQPAPERAEQVEAAPGIAVVSVPEEEGPALDRAAARNDQIARASEPARVAPAPLQEEVSQTETLPALEPASPKAGGAVADAPRLAVAPAADAIDGDLAALSQALRADPASETRFDVVRIDPQGQAVIAGQAPPGSEVEILLDGTIVATEAVDETGSFVSLLRVAGTGTPRRLSLRVAGAEQDRAELAARDPELAEPDVTRRSGTLDQAALQDAPAQAETDTRAVDLARANPAAPTAGALDAGAPSRPAIQSAAAAGSGPTVPRAPAETQVLSDEVLILPAEKDGAAPVLVRTGGGEGALLQPAPLDRSGVRLDRISYAEGGDVDLSGRAVTGNKVRIYINAKLAGVAEVVPPGVWTAELPVVRAKAAQLLRFDEIGQGGDVVSRIETPFTYAQADGPKTLTQREVEIARGDYLWRIAERYYGEGIRYSLIFSANSDLIRDPDLIYPGQVFTVPELVDSE
ncbi:MAG: LysM peptidoglycan-binding domain-containing protein [Pseudomonadota bacterium]